MYWFDSAYEAVSRFMDMGGDVLWAIAVLLFLLSLIHISEPTRPY